MATCISQNCGACGACGACGNEYTLIPSTNTPLVFPCIHKLCKRCVKKETRAAHPGEDEEWETAVWEVAFACLHCAKPVPGPVAALPVDTVTLRHSLAGRAADGEGKSSSIATTARRAFAMIVCIKPAKVNGRRTSSSPSPNTSSTTHRPCPQSCAGDTQTNPSSFTVGHVHWQCVCNAQLPTTTGILWRSLNSLGLRKILSSLR
jgi:hypothetical protein